MTTRHLGAALLLALSAAWAPAAHADSAVEAAVESVTRHITAVAPFSWDVSYDHAFDGISVVTRVEIAFLIPIPGYTDQQKAQWIAQTEAEVEYLWNDNFRIHDQANNRFYDLELDVVPVLPFSGADQTIDVTVRPASCDANPGDLACRDSMIHWFEDAHPSIKAHELGHMLGLFDEYPGGAVSPTSPITSNDGVMGFGALSDTPVFYSRYYQPFLAFMNRLGPDDIANPGGALSFADYQRVVGGNVSMPVFALVAVPEPGTWALMGAGLLLVAGIGRRGLRR